jgi:hypothetical protein
MQRLDAAKQNVGIQKDAPLAAIRIDRLTADGFIGQNGRTARMAFGPRPEGGSAFGGEESRFGGLTGNDGMNRLVQGLLGGLKATLAKSLRQDAFLFRLQFDCHCDTVPRLGKSSIPWHLGC